MWMPLCNFEELVPCEGCGVLLVQQYAAFKRHVTRGKQHPAQINSITVRSDFCALCRRIRKNVDVKEAEEAEPARARQQK